MSEIYKVVISFILFILWSVGMFGCGYVFSNRRAVERIEQTNNELAEQQRKYDDLIRESEERIRDIREQLSSKIFDNGKTTEELSKLIEIIRGQKLNI